MVTFNSYVTNFQRVSDSTANLFAEVMEMMERMEMMISSHNDYFKKPLDKG